MCEAKLKDYVNVYDRICFECAKKEPGYRAFEGATTTHVGKPCMVCKEVTTTVPCYKFGLDEREVTRKYDTSRAE